MAVSLLALAGGIASCAAPIADESSAPASEPAPDNPSPEPSPSSSVDPAAACDDVAQVEPTLEIQMTAASTSFDVDEIQGPRHCEPFTIVFTNNEAPSPGMETRHDIDIRAENVLGDLLFDGDVIGQTSIVYEVPGLPSGEHYFYCSNHPGAMSGTIIVAPAS